MESPEDIVQAFHRLYYGSAAQTWQNTFWNGIPTLKCPLDLWMYQELLTRNRPDVILETGTAAGGSALFLAHICDLLESGRIISIDTVLQERPTHPRIEYVCGSSVDPDIFTKISGSISSSEKVMVILDSDHTKEHVLAELRLYADLVTQNQYLIVEDTNVNGHPIFPEFGPGPMEAVQQFLVENKRFSVDTPCEKFLMTFNPGGYLRRI